MENTIVIASAFAICVTSAFLIWHKEYEDGLFGRIALGIMSIGALVMLVDQVRANVELLPSTVAIVLGVALFLVRHVWRFLQWRRCGEHSWRPASK